ncbi:hypothetical protein QYE76_064468 [Lolium multiflorum]|uniref:Ribonuclease H1 N-terminal domain-containing protein n=1 Tax=Lolium multiflorum TaxID=4521 RepID=A0AAD8S8D9_LOLMU|nr:hypothetical protein QYE76_064468 [Lolium multiflorum]
MEMAGAAARSGEKGKGGGKDSVTSQCAQWPISTSSSTVLPNFELLLPSASRMIADACLRWELSDPFASSRFTARDSKVAVTPLLVSDLVAQVAAEIAARLDTTKKNKNRREAERSLKTRQKGIATMKWLPFMSSFVLEKMCGLIQSVDHPKDTEFLSVPIANYDEMHTIFSFGLATGKYAMGSSEPLGSSAANPTPEDAETHESDTVNLDVEKAADAPEKDVVQAIRDNKPTDMHPDMYNAVMDMLGFAEDDLMAALSHLVDHKAQGSSFIGMIESHRVLWLRNYLGIYSSWRMCQDQVSGYSNNSYRGYEILEEAQQEYLTFPEEEFLEDQAIDEAVTLAQLPPEVRPSQAKDYIIAFLIVVIVRILFF